MSESRRIRDRIAAIDYESTLRFFEQRAARYSEVGPLSVTMYQDQDRDLAVERDRRERDRILPLLAPAGPVAVLDVGCGVGRWALHLEPHVRAYLGIDFSAGLLDIARARASEWPEPGRFRFQRLSAVELEGADLAVPGPFERILVAGVMVYLNDEDCAAMLRGISSVAASKCLLYVREPVARESRLTLERFYSEELRDQYSAIYRTQDQYLELFQRHLFPAGFELSLMEDLFPPDLHNRPETAQRVYLLRKGR